MNIIEKIHEYTPYNIQEEKDKKIILDFLNKYEDSFYRSNYDRDFCLLVYKRNGAHCAPLEDVLLEIILSSSFSGRGIR